MGKGTFNGLQAVCENQKKMMLISFSNHSHHHNRHLFPRQKIRRETEQNLNVFPRVGLEWAQLAKLINIWSNIGQPGPQSDTAQSGHIAT